jgi:hypothetical protein
VSLLRRFAGVPRYDELFIDCGRAKVAQFPEQRMAQASARRVHQIVGYSPIEARPNEFCRLRNQGSEQVLERKGFVFAAGVVDAFFAVSQGGLDPNRIGSPGRPDGGSFASDRRKTLQDPVDGPPVPLQPLTK